MNTKKKSRSKANAPISDFPQKKAMKIEIARQIAAHLRDSNITQAEAAVAYKIDQAVMSRICNANLDIFTVDRLIGMAESMGIVVNINFGD